MRGDKWYAKRSKELYVYLLIIQQAQKWIGYVEKKSNKNLDDFSANAGKNNYTGSIGITCPS